MGYWKNANQLLLRAKMEIVADHLTIVQDTFKDDSGLVAENETKVLFEFSVCVPTVSRDPQIAALMRRHSTQMLEVFMF